MKDTKAFRLGYGGKPSWFDCHRRFLPPNHPFRRNKRRFKRNQDEKDAPPYMLKEEEVFEFLHDFPKVTEHKP